MDWIEQVKTQYTIVTGDGQAYFPEWLIASMGKSMDFNYSEFVFIGVKGSFVDRRLNKGRRYDLEIIFDGKDCLNTANAFFKSCENTGSWALVHPLYNKILVQPTSIELDNSSYNVSRILCSVIETIVPKNKQVNGFSSVQRIEQVKSLRKVSTDKTTDGFVADNPAIEPSALSKLSDSIGVCYRSIRDKITYADDYVGFTYAYGEFVGAISEAVPVPLKIIAQCQTFLLNVSLFGDPISDKINLLVTQFGILKSMITAPFVTTQQKSMYEACVAATIAAMCDTSVANNDYQNRQAVIDVIDIIAGSYDDYITTVDGLMSENGAVIGGYMPNAESFISLNEMINYTIATLYDIANNSKTKYVIEMENDTNIINLAYRIYGLNANDSTIDDIIAQNTIGITEMLNIRKGRKITYYK